jgi:formate hydrogenlyase transcriptional activator
MSLETQRQSDKVRIQQYQTLLEISEAIASNRDLASLFRNLAQHLREVVDFDWVSTLLYDPARDVMRIHMLEPPQPEGLIGPAEMPVDDVPSGWAWKTQEPLIIQDVARETRFPQFNRWARQNGVKSYCALPLTSAGRRLGALGFASVKNVVWKDDDLEFLTQVARQVAVAIDNAINFESVRSAERRAARDRDHSQLLLEINNAVASHLDLRELLRAISPCLRKVIYHDFAGLVLYDAESRQLRAHALDFPIDKDILEEGVVFPLEGTPSGLAFTSRRTVIVRNLEQERFASTPLVKILRAEGVKSGCSVPLIAHGEAVGVLTLMSLREEAFSESDAELLTQIGGQIALAVENALSFDRARQAERRAARERDRIRLLLDINNAIVSHLELGALVKTISASLLGILPHEAAGIALYEPEQNLLREYENVAYEGFIAFQKGMAMPLEGTPAGLVFTSGQPLLLKRPDPERFPVDPGQRATEGSRNSACLAPLISHGRKLGILGVGSAKEDRFTEEDLELLAQVADQVAIAVENSVNFERAREAERELERKLDHLRLMLRVTNTVVSQLNLKELLDVISATICEEMGCDTAGVGLYDQKSEQLIAFSTQFPPGHPFRDKGISIPFEGTPGGLAFTTGQPVFLDKPDPERFNSHYARRILEDGYRSGGSIPLIAQGRKLGVLGVASKRENSLSDDDRELLVQVANQVAIAVDNALNYGRAREAERELARSLDHLRLMLKITTAVVSKLDLGEILKVISSSIREVMRNDIVGVNLFDQESGQLRTIAFDLSSELIVNEEWLRIPLENTLPGIAFTSGQPSFVDKADSDSLISDYDKRGYELGYISGGNIPLIAQGRKLGVLGFASKREYAYSDDDKELLCQIANQAAIAVDNALNFERARKAEEHAKRQSERLQLLLDINNAVVSNLNLPELLTAISAGLRRVLPHDFAGMALYDADSGQLRVQALDHTLNQELFGTTDLIPMKGTGAGKAFTSRKTVLLRRLDPMESSLEIVRRVVAAGFKSSCNVPLISRDRALGTLDVLSFREDAFTEEDTELLGQIATQIAIAVENSLNFERARAAELEVKRQYDRLRLMLEINNAIVSRLDLRDLISGAAACLREVLHHDIAGLSLYDPDTNQLRAYAYDFPDKQFVIPEGTPIPLEGSLGGMAFTSGRSVFVNRTGSEEIVSDFNKRFTELGVKSGGCVPLIVQGRKLGVLGVASLREDAFPEDQQELLTQIAAQIAIAVDNALNFERALKAEQEARRHFDHLGLVLRINNAVVSQLDLHELLQVISRSLREMAPHDTTGIALYEPESDKLRLVMTDFPEQMELVEERYLVPLEGTVMGLAFTSGEPVFLDEYDLERFPSDFTRRSYDAGLRSCGNIPLIAHGRKLGALGVASKRPNAFSAEDIELLCQSANQIAIAVENALNFERARVAEQQAKRQSDRLQLLLNLNNAIASALDPPALFRAVSASLRQVFQHDFAILGLYDERKKELGAYVIDSADGLNLFEEGMATPIEGTPAELAVATKRVVIIGPGDAQKYSSEMVRRSVELGLRSSCTAPLLRHNRVIGVMTIASKREAVFTPDDGELFLQIAGQIAIAVENALAYREIDALKNKLASEKLYLEDEIRTEHNFEELIGASQSFKRILKQVETVAPTDSTVLIRGETGTGKELIARAIHSLSGRNERTLVKINCAAIPTGLLESELFGHEKGAFTGAIAQRVGRFELANKGSLFLDEVGDIPFELQPKLLRVLQEQEFERLGSARTQKVDVRLIAATNADLEQLVADKKYRSDLYYRLNVFPITIPPLRERAEDIPALTRFFTQKYARRLKKRIEAIPAEVMTAITNYRWPGNVRELEHFIERAVVLTLGPELEVSLSELKSSAPAVPVKISTLEDAERGHIIRALDEANWVIGGPNGAAARLGMKRTTLQSKMQKLGISRSQG